MPQIIVGNEQNIFLFERAHDFERVGRSHAYVAVRFQLRGGIDITDHREIGHALFEFFDLSDARHVRHGAIGGKFGKEHLFIGIEDLRALAHKLHAAEYEHVRLGFGGDFRQIKTVPHKVGG